MKKVIKEFKKLPEDVKLAIKEEYQEGGLVQDIVVIKNAKNEELVVLPFNTTEVAYLVRLPKEDIEAENLNNDYTAEDIFHDE